MLAGKLGVQHDAERNIQFLEQSADARDASVDRVLTEGLIHEVRVAGRQIRAEDRTLAEAELLDEQRKTDRDLSAGRPGGNVDRLASEAGHPVASILCQARGGKVDAKQAAQSGDNTGAPDR